MTTVVAVLALMGWSFAWYCHARMRRQTDQTRTIRNLEASNASLVHALGNWITKEQQAQQRLEELWAEHCGNAAREERTWQAIQKRVHMEHSPIAVTFPDAVLDSEAASGLLGLCIGEREVDE